MRFRSVRLALVPAFASILLLALVATPAVAQERPLELTDLMRFRTLHDPVISDDGAWIAYESRPDRGDGEVLVRSTDGESVYRIERGSAPRISSDAGWVGALVKPPLEEVVKAEEGSKKTGGEDDGPKTGFALLATADGSVTSYGRVKSFAFSEDGRWVAIHRFPPEEDADEPGSPEEPGGEMEVPEPEPGTPPEPAPPQPEEQTRGGGEGEEEAEPEDERVGSPLVLRELVTGREVEIPYVEHYAFDEPADHLAFAVAAPGGEGNGLYLRPLVQGAGDSQPPEQALHRAERGRYSALAWAPERSLLGFVAAVDDEDGESGEADVWVWSPSPDGPEGTGRPRAARTAATSDGAPEGWFVPSVNELTWSEDGERLFFGFKPEDEAPRDDEAEEGQEGESEEEPFDPYDVEAILEERTVDVWHWNDPLIIPNQKERWEEEKDRTYLAVWHREADRVVPLAGREMREVAPVDNPRAVLGLADVPYLREITWDGWYRDVYRVDLEDGSRQLVAERLEEEASLSPGGRYVAYYRSPHWYLFDGETGAVRNLTEGLGVPFADEDHDYPGPAPGYGVADWVSRDGEDTAVLIYDKYDVWQLPVDAPTRAAGGEPIRLTDGRGDERIFRVVDPDPEKDERLDHVEPGERLLLTGYHDRRKHRGVFAARVGEPARTGFRELVDEPGKTYDLGPRAEEAERILFTRESYAEFPDLWVADLGPDLELDGRRKLSDANPQIDRFAWGESELVEWTSPDGEPLQGVLIKPAGYREGERVPVLVYFYRTYSYRVHRFNEPVVNHRPSFPYYASRGYAVFLPDIRFEVGRPGLAATKCLVSAVQHLVEMGVADPDAVGLQGHSWAGYQAAFVITQTDLFAAAAAGAPVSNMTSAYGGIRWGTGLARQFQYEQSQSRLGASLWEARDRYIENSPLFYADRIETPLLIEFGDEDGAVPWTQGIELYLAMRRLGKEAFFLQYRGEPHHLTRYGNKLDYSIKMREFFDHYLKGEPAPEWMTEGVPYRGE